MTMHRFTARALTSVGSSAFSKCQRARSISGWRPYDIVKTGDDTYRISIAVAGFSQADLDTAFQSNLLTVTGKKHPPMAASIAALPAVRSNTGS